MKIRLTCAVLAAAMFALCLPGALPADAAQATNPYKLKFPYQCGYFWMPEDEGSHPNLSKDGGVEWWGFYGTLGSPDGQRFTVATKFWDLQFPWLDLVGEWGLDMPEMAIMSIGHLNTGKQYNSHTGVAIDGESIDLSKLNLSYDRNSIREVGPFVYDVTWEDTDNNVVIKLRLQAQRNPLPIGWDGIVQFTAGYEQNIYAITRLVAKGTVTIGGGPAIPVQGMFGMDHGWYPSILYQHLDFLGTRDNYEYFAIQLNDSTDIVMWSIARDGNRADYIPAVNILYPNGEFEYFTDEEVDTLRIPTITSKGHYANEESGNKYNLGWTISIPSASIDLELTPFFNAQEMVSQDTVFQDNSVYAGMCDVRGTVSKRAVVGQAYVESTNRLPEARKPNPPTNLKATSTSGGVVLSWDPVAINNLREYKVYLGSESRTYTFTLSAGTSTTYVIQGLENMERYYFAVTARTRTNDESFFSEEVKAFPNDGLTPYVDIVTDLPCVTGGMELNIGMRTINPGNGAIPVDVYVFLQLPDLSLIQLRGNDAAPELFLGPFGAPSQKWNIPGRFEGIQSLYKLKLDNEIFGVYLPLKLLVATLYNPPSDFPEPGSLQTPVLIDIDEVPLCIQ